MSRSGVGLGPQVVPAFEELKSRRSKYIIYKLSADNKTIEVEKTGSDTDYEAFLSLLPEDDCRYAVYDLEYEIDPTEGKRSKICMISWSPDNARIKSKMVYASSKDALRRALTAVAIEIQGSDFSEVSEETLIERAKRGK